MKSKAVLLLLIIFQASQIDADYQIGVGRADCTGPVAEIIFVSTRKVVLQKLPSLVLDGLREAVPGGVWFTLATILEGFYRRRWGESSCFRLDRLCHDEPWRQKTGTSEFVQNVVLLEVISGFEKSRSSS
jgi:hypothetical protein